VRFENTAWEHACEASIAHTSRAVRYERKMFLVQATVVSLTHLLVGDSCPHFLSAHCLGMFRTDGQTKQAFFKNIFDVFPEINRQVLFLFCFPVCYIGIR